MAYITPQKPVGRITNSVNKTFQLLKSLPDGYKIWHHLGLWDEQAPDFLVLNGNNHALLVVVSDANNTQVKSKAQMILLGDKKEEIGKKETLLLYDFINRFVEKANTKIEAAIERVSCVIIFPNLSHKTCQEIRLKNIPKYIKWIGKEYLQANSHAYWEILFPPSSLDTITYQIIKEKITPETVVPRSITVRESTDRNIKAGLEDFLLDLRQEWILKNDLILSQQGESLSGDFDISLVNGVAGSGKTLILLYRLRLLMKLYPSKSFLVLTHNRPLIRDMENKYKNLENDAQGEVSWSTFYKFLRDNMKGGGWKKPLSQSKKREKIIQVWNEYFLDTSITYGMLRSEFNYINDQVDRSEDAYLAMNRKGRGFRLTQDQKKLMYRAYNDYINMLGNYTDWGIIPHTFVDFVNSGKIKLPIYDFVFIDEAQFFAPIWFEIIRKLVKPNTGYIFLVADPTQGFLNNGISWKSMGLEVRGHSYSLKRSYRTSEEILKFATLFYRERVPEDEINDDIIKPEFDKMPEGRTPILIQLNSRQDEIVRVVNEIKVFISNGIKKSQILILHADWKGVKNLIKKINIELGEGAADDPKMRVPGDFIRVTTMNAGTGIESPFVFLLGLNQLFEEEESLRLSDVEREKIIVENSRKIYMAITRASQLVILTYIGELPISFKGISKTT